MAAMTETKPKRGRPPKFGEKMTVELYTRVTPAQAKAFRELFAHDVRYKDAAEAIRGLVLEAIEKGRLP